jgi:NIMA (never in mitosis gene a)-related kinase
MACLRVPFRGTSIHQLYINIMKGKYEEIPKIYSNDLKDIIRLILCLDPVKRPSAEELLNHEIIKRKIKEIGLNNWENNETALLLKTIKIPKNISQINLQLPQKQYSKEHNIEQMMKNDEYETAKQNYYRPESAGKIISIQNKFNFNFDDIGRNYGINEDKKMKTLDEEKIVEKLLDKKDSNKIKKETKNNNKKLNKENTNSSLTY